MYVSVAIFSSLLAGQALASMNALAAFPAMGMSKRQSGDSFIPGTTPGCPDDWPICGTSNICYDPSQGDVCCPGGTYACPGGSFCLQDPYCCPDGLDAETCARNNGITLTSTSAPPTSAPTSKPVIPTGSSSASTPVIPVPTTTTTPAPEPPVFTGGASARVGGAVAAVLGGLGVVGNLLI